jgi:hypothetical protein
MINEDFLAYIWKHQYFDKSDLRISTGLPLAILKTGFQNTNAGPDFFNASVLIDFITWAGSVEFHVNASDWLRHKHTSDLKYDQVILHVVWNNDLAIKRTDGSEVPVLELKSRVATGMLQTYQQLQETRFSIPCGQLLHSASEISRTMMLERVLLDRLKTKAGIILTEHSKTGRNWEETLYRSILKGYGFKINQPGFEKLATVLPLHIIRKHRHNLRQTEALVFGQAGYLETAEDAYISDLQKEYRFLHHKYQLAPPMNLSDWNFLRLRPANFPTVRLAQLAALISSQEHWFATLFQSENLSLLYKFFSAEPSAYWQTHYMPAKAGKLKISSLGKNSIELLIINVVVPLLVAFSRDRQQPELTDKALNLLDQLKPEENSIMQMYQSLGFENRSAARSQGILELHNNYCKPVRCLHCAIGNSILKRAKSN